MGRGTKFPPQFGQAPFRCPSTQSTQNVHSNEQTRASDDVGGRSLSQHSQLGFRISIRGASCFDRSSILIFDMA